MAIVHLHSSDYGLFYAEMTGAVTLAAVGDAVADLGALTAATPAAQTSVVAVGVAPIKAEFDATVADITVLRTQLAASVADLATLRTKVNALLDSLQGAGIITA